MECFRGRRCFSGAPANGAAALQRIHTCSSAVRFCESARAETPSVSSPRTVASAAPMDCSPSGCAARPPLHSRYRRDVLESRISWLRPSHPRQCVLGVPRAQAAGHRVPLACACVDGADAATAAQQTVMGNGNGNGGKSPEPAVQTACAAKCRTCARRARRRLGELDGGSSPLAWAIVRCFAALRSAGRS